MKPTVLPVELDRIPPELRDIDRWVLWRLVPRQQADGPTVWAKLPMTAKGKTASSTDASTWTSFDEAAAAYMLGDPNGRDFDGVGFVFTGDDGVHGIDVDDCRDPETGELNALGQEVLERVDGYAEVSPSGTGIKIFTRTNLDGTRTKKEAGLEMYTGGRYFTATGHTLNGHSALPADVQDVGWLVERVWHEPLRERGEPSADAALRAFENYKPPLDGWDLYRVETEVMPYLDPDSGYADWLQVGQALHHQGGGDEEWLALWDSWSATGSKYVEGECAAKWRTFSESSLRHRPVTLATLLAWTKDNRKQALVTVRTNLVDELLQRIEAIDEPRLLQDEVAQRVSHELSLSDIDREQIASALQARARALGVRLPIGTIRQWVALRSAGIGFPDLDDDGRPRHTLDNLRVMLNRLGYTVRYNVISKQIEVLIPGAAFSRDNRGNASLAVLLSESERVGMSTRHMTPFITALADENPYNPVATWVESQPWDGTSRLDAFYDTVVSSSDQALKNMLLRKWLIQAIAAAFSPNGIAAQGVLTYVGAQNLGKTTWFQKLAPKDLDVILTGHSLDTRNKDSILVAVSYWIVELGELDATFKKSDISALKSFVTQPLDKIRRPYAPVEAEYGRRTVFGGTVNDEQFLSDPTGNRRFWTLAVEGFNLDHSVDMQQLWAEVLELWKGGETFWLDRSDVDTLNKHNEEFLVSDPVAERIGSRFAWQADRSKWVWLTATDAAVRAGFREPNRATAISAAREIKKRNGGSRRKSNGTVLLLVPPDVDAFLEVEDEVL